MFDYDETNRPTGGVHTDSQSATAERTTDIDISKELYDEVQKLGNDAPIQEVFDMLQKCLTGYHDVFVAKNFPEAAGIIQGCIDQNKEVWEKCLAETDPKYMRDDNGKEFHRFVAGKLVAASAQVSDMIVFAVSQGFAR